MKIGLQTQKAKRSRLNDRTKEKNNNKASHCGCNVTNKIELTSDLPKYKNKD